MSSVSSATSSNVAYSTQKSLFSKLDTDQDGSLTKDEFVAGRPKDVTASQASKLYSSMDTDSTGSVTEDQFNDGMDQNRPSTGIASLLSSDAMAILMLMSQQGGQSFSATSTDGTDSSTSATGGVPSISELYSDMDSDGDGSVSQAEFVAARPDDMSEDDANSLFASIDTEGKGAITEDQFAASMQPPAGPPPGGMGGAGGAGGAPSSDEVYDALDTNQDGVVSETEFLAGRPDDVTDSQAQDTYDSIDTDGTGSITRDQLADFMSGGSDDTTTTEASLGQQLADLLSSSSATSTSSSSGNGIDDLLTMLESLNSSGTEAA